MPVQCLGSTRTPRSVDSDLPSAMLCRRLGKNCCINFLQWEKLPTQLLVPTPGSHLTVPSFVPMQLCTHSKSDHRNNLSQWLSVAELRCRKKNLLSKFWYQRLSMKLHSCPFGTSAVTETGWRHSRTCSPDGDGLLCPTQLSSYTGFTWLVKTPELKKGYSPAQLHNLGAFWGSFQHPLPPAKRKPALMYGPWHGAPRTGEHKTQEVCWFVFTAW